MMRGQALSLLSRVVADRWASHQPGCHSTVDAGIGAITVETSTQPRRLRFGRAVAGRFAERSTQLRLACPSNLTNASRDASRLGANSCCHNRSGTSVAESNLSASRRYSRLRHSVMRGSPNADGTNPASSRSRRTTDPRRPTPIPFIRLCRPSAKGRTPRVDAFASLTARQSEQAIHAQRVGPPAVARKQMTHNSDSRDTSQSAQRSGASSSRQDCHRTVLRSNTGPRRPPHGMCTDSSRIRSRSAASVALN